MLHGPQKLLSNHTAMCAIPDIFHECPPTPSATQALHRNVWCVRLQATLQLLKGCEQNTGVTSGSAAKLQWQVWVDSYGVLLNLQSMMIVIRRMDPTLAVNHKCA